MSSLSQSSVADSALGDIPPNGVTVGAGLSVGGGSKSVWAWTEVIALNGPRKLWGGKTSREHRLAMLTVRSNFSGSCSPPCKPRRVHTRIWYSRTCSYAINSRCSPVRREADRRHGFASGTSCCR